jgi:hypothetical protein
MWVQPVAQQPDIKISVTTSADNQADIGTKYLSASRLRELRQMIGVRVQEEKFDEVMMITANDNDYESIETFGSEVEITSPEQQVPRMPLEVVLGIAGALLVCVAVGLYIVWLLVRRLIKKLTEVKCVEGAHSGSSSEDSPGDRSTSRSIATQSQVTYMRKVSKPRFSVLREEMQGAFESTNL